MPQPFWKVLLEWMAQHDVLLWWVGIGSAAISLGSLLALPLVVARIPDDYFATRERPPIVGRSRHPVWRWLLRIAKNLAGLFLVAFGLLLVPLPGQGLLTALVGLLMMEFPGKRRLELNLVRRRGVLRAINWLRVRRSRPPLTVWTPGGFIRLPVPRSKPERAARGPVVSEPAPGRQVESIVPLDRHV